VIICCMMSAKSCIFGPFNLYLLSPYICYFHMFLVSFGVLVFCGSLRENCNLKVEIAMKLKSSERAIERIVPRLSTSALDLM
jgi:hypothetical protein